MAMASCGSFASILYSFACLLAFYLAFLHIPPFLRCLFLHLLLFSTRLPLGLFLRFLQFLLRLVLFHMYIPLHYVHTPYIMYICINMYLGSSTNKSGALHLFLTGSGWFRLQWFRLQWFRRAAGDSMRRRDSVCMATMYHVLSRPSTLRLARPARTCPALHTVLCPVSPCPAPRRPACAVPPSHVCPPHCENSTPLPLHLHPSASSTPSSSTHLHLHLPLICAISRTSASSTSLHSKNIFSRHPLPSSPSPSSSSSSLLFHRRPSRPLPLSITVLPPSITATAIHHRHRLSWHLQYSVYCSLMFFTLISPSLSQFIIIVHHRPLLTLSVAEWLFGGKESKHCQHPRPPTWLAGWLRRHHSTWHRSHRSHR